MSSLGASQNKLSRKRPIPFQGFLSSDGTPTGTWNLIGDYSGAPVDFWFDTAVNPGAQTVVTGISVSVSAVGAPPSVADYGELVGGLTNGFNFWYDRTSTGRIPITDTIKTNLDLEMMIGSMVVQEWDAGAGVPASLHFRGNSLLFGAGIPLPENDASLLGVTLNDDFTVPAPFDVHVIQVRGYFFDNPEAWIT